MLEQMAQREAAHQSTFLRSIKQYQLAIGCNFKRKEGRKEIGGEALIPMKPFHEHPSQNLCPLKKCQPMLPTNLRKGKIK